jgi:histidine ammonia-lyase
MTLLRRLEALSHEQADLSQSGSLDRIGEIVEERERLMAALVTIEHGLKPIRLQIAEGRTILSDLPEFKAVAALHREAADLASAVLTADEISIEALKAAEIARRATAQALEQGESTLAAYRRVVTPELGSSALVSRKG